jgi:glutamate-ammonia-ligase adenylyltransferase
MDLLRQRFRQNLFQAATRDVIQPRPVYDSLAHTTLLSERAIAAAAEVAGAPADFAVLALGRLGTWEFDWASDADLLFVRAEECDNKVAIASAQRIMEVLTAYTRFGNLFAVDARLRPHGGEGELVNTAASLRQYFSDEAQAWEALTFTKLRFIAGSAEVGANAIDEIKNSIRRFASDNSFTHEVREMRNRLQQAASLHDFKNSAGGFYDIDFVISVLQVKNNLVPSSINTREQIKEFT